MANYRAIAATSSALAGLIRDRYPDEFGPGLEVALYQTRDFASPMQEGFSVYLFRIAVNGSVRNRSPRRTADGRRWRPSLPLDLNYMITAWAQDVEKQHRMLGWAMRELENVSVLSASQLNHYIALAESPGLEPAPAETFAPTEGVEIVCDPLSLADYLTLWDRLVPKMPVSATYTLRSVLLDSLVQLGDPSLVQTRTFDGALEVG
jgi:hypothetical protein